MGHKGLHNWVEKKVERDLEWGEGVHHHPMIRRLSISEGIKFNTKRENERLKRNQEAGDRFRRTGRL